MNKGVRVSQLIILFSVWIHAFYGNLFVVVSILFSSYSCGIAWPMLSGIMQVLSSSHYKKKYCHDCIICTNYLHINGLTIFDNKRVMCFCGSWFTGQESVFWVSLFVYLKGRGNWLTYLHLFFKRSRTFG